MKTYFLRIPLWMECDKRNFLSKIARVIKILQIRKRIWICVCGAFVYTYAYKIILDIFHRQISEFLALFSKLQAASCSFRYEILQENAIGCGKWYYLHTWTTGSQRDGWRTRVRGEARHDTETIRFSWKIKADPPDPLTL